MHPCKFKINILRCTVSKTSKSAVQCSISPFTPPNPQKYLAPFPARLACRSSVQNPSSSP